MLHSLLAIVVVATPPTPYEVDPVVDTVTTVGIFGVLGLLDGTVKPVMPGGITCGQRLDNGRCDPQKLVALDRSTVGNDSKTWATVSDVGAGLAYALPLIFDAIDVASSDQEGRLLAYGTDVLVMAESVAVATALTHMLKWSVRRPRPTQYREGAFVGSVEHQLSFPSGHTSSTSAAVAAYATTFVLRHPRSPWVFAVIGGAAALTAVTGYGRIGGGWHFPTDVLAGAILGAATGVVVPLLHERKMTVELTVPAAPPSASATDSFGIGVALRGSL